MKNKLGEVKNELAGRHLSVSRPGNQKNTKDREVSIFTEFIRRMRVDEAKVSIDSNSETPDLIVSIGDQKIGVEITTFYTDKTKKGSRGNTLFESWRKFSEALNLELNQLGMGGWYGAVHFIDTFSFLNLNKDELQKEIINLAKNYLLKSSEERLKIKPQPDSYSAKYIDHVYCQNVSPITDQLWWHSSLQSGLVPVSGVTNKIIEICHGKDEKLSKNKNQKLENWLVIFARGAHIWEMAILVDTFLHRHEQDKILIEQRPELDELKLKSISRVFVWNKHPEAIWEITPGRHVIFHQDREGHLIRINKVPEIFQKIKL